MQAAPLSPEAVASLEVQAQHLREAAHGHKQLVASHRRAMRREMQRLAHIERSLGRFNIKVVVVNDPRKARKGEQSDGNAREHDA